MTFAKTANPVLAKAARVALVFLLVFWSSFRVEYALAAQERAPEGLDGHEPGTLVELTVYELDRSNPNLLGGLICSASQTALGSRGASSATVGESVMYVAVATWEGIAPASGDERVKTAKFVKWEVDGVPVGAADGVLVLDTATAGQKRVTCHLSDGDASYISAGFAEAHPGMPFEAAFDVNVAEPVTEPDDNPGGGGEPGTGDGQDEAMLPDVKPITILGADGEEIESPLPLESEDTYQFDVRLTVNDGVTSEPLFEYRQSESETGLADLSGGQLTDVAWSLSSEAEGIADIDKATGLLTVHGDGEFTVACSVSPQSAPDQSWSATVRVKAGEGTVEPPQADDPQEEDYSEQVKSITVVADLTPLREASSESDDSSDSAASDGTDEAGDAEAASGEGAAGSAEAGEVADETDGDNEGEAPEVSTEGDEPDKAEPTILQRTYELDELIENFEHGTGTYTMPTIAGPVTITGSGVWLADLLEGAGIDVEAVPIESVDFISYTGATTTVSWSELTSGNSSLSDVLIALESRVHADDVQEPEAEEGDDGEPLPEGEGDGLQLSPSTRFRVLFNTSNTAIDASTLRWVNTIRVNPKVPEPSKPPAHNDVFSASVSYVPVPVGVTAVLVAVPSHTINGRWDCLWEESTDGGSSWHEIENSAVQTLYVPTTQGRLGNQYRVTLSSNIKDDESGEFLMSTSDPVTLQAGSGFSVVLAFNPPVAGDMAIFQSKIYGYSGNEGDVTYKWEWTEDGGASWSTIDEGQTGASLSLPTEPASEEDLSEEVSSSEQSAANLIYIRVSASAPDPDNPGASLYAVSNMQPLTVRVGDAGDAGGVPDLPSDPPGGGGASTESGTDATEPPSDPVPEPVPSAPASTVVEIDSIVMEPTSAPSPSDFTPDGTDEPAQDSAQKPAPNPTQIYISEEVSAQVAEQNEAVEQYVQSTQPGARWTSLNTVVPQGDDVDAVLADNPFAPFVMPLALGVTASGVVEKLLAFRRQLL